MRPAKQRSTPQEDALRTPSYGYLSADAEGMERYTQFAFRNALEEEFDVGIRWAGAD